MNELADSEIFKSVLEDQLEFEKLLSLVGLAKDLLLMPKSSELQDLHGWRDEETEFQLYGSLQLLAIPRDVEVGQGYHPFVPRAIAG